MPVASPEDLQDFMKKQNMGQSAAQTFLNDYMVLKRLAEEFDSPLVEHLRGRLETSLRQHGVALLEEHEPKEPWITTCDCGKKHNLHRLYFHVYNEVWKDITSIIKNWYKKNTAIKEGGSR